MLKISSRHQKRIDSQFTEYDTALLAHPLIIEQRINGLLLRSSEEPLLANALVDSNE